MVLSISKSIPRYHLMFHHHGVKGQVAQMASANGQVGGNPPVAGVVASVHQSWNGTQCFRPTCLVNEGLH
jgi:hypothetical protein